MGKLRAEILRLSGLLQQADHKSIDGMGVAHHLDAGHRRLRTARQILVIELKAMARTNTTRQEDINKLVTFVGGHWRGTRAIYIEAKDAFRK